MLYFEIFSRIQPEPQSKQLFDLEETEMQQTDYDLQKSDRDESNLIVQDPGK